MRWLAALGKTIGAILLFLVLAVVAGAVIPENARWQEAEGGITIFVDGTAAHTEVILPVAAAGHDWRGRIKPAHFPDGGFPDRWLSFSWGEREFFLTTPSWGDFRLSTGLNALLRGEQTLVHVYRIDRAPQGGPVTLTPNQYRQLVAWIEAQFDDTEEVIAGYGPNDAFFPSRGRYSPIRTCNQWTRDALAAAGVRVGRWTPFSQSLMWRFPSEETDG
ncbi:MAG: TIGR02117 family protein [Thermaurantiacus sp.]